MLTKKLKVVGRPVNVARIQSVCCWHHGQYCCTTRHIGQKKKYILACMRPSRMHRSSTETGQAPCSRLRNHSVCTAVCRDVGFTAAVVTAAIATAVYLII